MQILNLSYRVGAEEEVQTLVQQGAPREEIEKAFEEQESRFVEAMQEQNSEYEEHLPSTGDLEPEVYDAFFCD